MRLREREMIMRNLHLLLVAMMIVACQPYRPIQPLETPNDQGTSYPVETTEYMSSVQAVGEIRGLAPFLVDLSRPFAQDVSLTHWLPKVAGFQDINLPVDLSLITNRSVLDGLTPAQKSFLATNGFVVIHSQEPQFGAIRTQVAIETGQPYYLTTDAALHAVHLQFDELLKAFEVQQLLPMTLEVTKATLDGVYSYLPLAKGTSLEADTMQALAYLSVALKLLDPSAEIEPVVADVVDAQVTQILEAGGRDESSLFNAFGVRFEDDYGAYLPVGHYAGIPELEQYFRGMTWYGRVHFKFSDASRVPVIITLAMRQAEIDDKPLSEHWGYLHETMSFLIGPTDDIGPLEYAALQDEIYGDGLTFRDLADPVLWQEFIAASDRLPAPQINSTFVDWTAQLSREKGWRFLGQRFTLDGLIMQNLIYDKLQEQVDGTRRDFPSGLDVMAALGSASAEQSLDHLGVTDFPNYHKQLASLQQTVAGQTERHWGSSFYSAWLYSFLPILDLGDNIYPAYMQTTAWSYRSLNTALGSWAELKHDTALYTKRPEVAGGGGPPSSDAAPAYVEPNPEGFYRMAYMTGLLARGLEARLNLHPPAGSMGSSGLSIYDHGMGMWDLSERLLQLGNIAAAELAGEIITSEDYRVISSCLGMIECMYEENPYNQPYGEMPLPPVVAAVSGAGQSVLEVGTGYVDRIYVVVPLEGQWEVAQGGVFSYYEFIQPRSQVLTDEEWRTRLTGSNAPALPSWASNFVLTGGRPVSRLFFRANDVYIVTTAGDFLYVHAEPSTTSPVLVELRAGDYIRIVEGPVTNGLTWWKIQCEFCWHNRDVEASGWVLERPDWYERAHGQ